MSEICNSIIKSIGSTSIVKLNNTVPEDAADVHVKIETFNPGSSIEGRIAPCMTEDIEKAGIIKSSDTIVEPTSGDTGIGLAWAGVAKDHKVITVMPETMSIERRKVIQAYGTELVLTPGSEGMEGAITKAEGIAEEKSGWVPLQSTSPSNPAVYEDTTGAEIVEASGPVGFDAFIFDVGVGGTVSSVSHTLKKANSNAQVYATEADESAAFSGKKSDPHRIQGISAGFTLDAFDIKAYDGVIRVASDDAVITNRNPGGRERFPAGIFSGAAIYIATEEAKGLGKGKEVLILLPGDGERYLSISLYDFND